MIIQFLSKYLSRKFIVTLLIMILAPLIPYIYKVNGVSDSISMAVLALIGGVGAAYGVLNVAQDKVEKNK